MKRLIAILLAMATMAGAGTNFVDEEHYLPESGWITITNWPAVPDYSLTIDGEEIEIGANCITTTVATNTVPEYRCQKCEDNAHLFYGEYHDQNIRIDTTTVTETKTLTITWDGTDYTVQRVKVLSETKKRMVKRETWVEDDKKPRDDYKHPRIEWETMPNTDLIYMDSKQN